MKNILIINNAAIGGGVESVMYNLSIYLLQKGNNVTVYTTFNEYDFYEKYPKEIKYIHLSIPNQNRFKKEYDKIKLKKIKKSLEKRITEGFLKLKKYDVIIAIKEGEPMKIASKFNADKKFGWVHVDYNYLYWTKHIFDNEKSECECMKNNFDKIVCVSNVTAESVKNVIGDPGNLCVKYNPMEYKEIIKSSQEKCEFVKPEGKTLFVTAGRLTKQKNYIALVESCIKLSKSYDFELWIIGNGEQYDILKKMIDEAECTNIKLLGFQPNPYSIIKMADWFVSSAVWESYGLAIQEALILEVPVLTTICPAIEEVFDDKFGIMFESDNAAIYDNLEYVLKNPDVATKYRNNIKEYYCADELWENRLEDICSLWE